MLTLKIAGRWEPQDFIEALRSVESFYYKLTLERSGRSVEDSFWLGYYPSRREYDRLPFEIALDHINQGLLERARYKAPLNQRLIVRRIRYASPGGIDLLGVGKACEVICNSIARMKVYYDDRHLRRERDTQATLDTEFKRLQIEKERESLQSIKIKNARDALELLHTHPEAEELLMPLLVRDQDPLADLIGERKLISATMFHSDRKRD